MTDLPKFVEIKMGDLYMKLTENLVEIEEVKSILSIFEEMFKALNDSEGKYD